MLSRFRPRTVGYWFFTLLVVYENGAGFTWTVSHIEYLRVMLTHLGYPQYFANILGPWQLACAATLIAPRFPLVKEWAYAGAFFNYSSAVVSHVAVGDGLNQWFFALLMTALTVCSWALRPPDRRIARPTQRGAVSLWSWIVPAVALVLMVIAALFTLPPPPRF
jgi:hypothetical protein